MGRVAHRQHQERWRRNRDHRLGHAGAASVHGHDCHHHQRNGGARDLLSIAVGLVPCSGAALVLAYALANGLLLSTAA